MTTVSYPSERYPAPPTVSIDIPDTWETLSVPGVAIAARATEQRPDFTPNVIVRVGTRALHDQPADIVMEVAGAMQGRPDAVVGSPETVEVGGEQWIRIEVSWSDGQGTAIRQVHLSRGIPRDEAVQDFVHLTGSTGGAGLESDQPAVESVLGSVALTR